MKTTVTDEPDVVGVDFKRWHKLVVDAAPIRNCLSFFLKHFDRIQKKN